MDIQEKTQEMNSTMRRIADDIAGRISSGELAHGDRLDSEKKLCEQYDAGVYDVRKAVNELKERGLLYTVPKFGTYVKTQTMRPTSAEFADSHELHRITLQTDSRFTEGCDLWRELAAVFAENDPCGALEIKYYHDLQRDVNAGDIMEFGAFYDQYYDQRELLLDIAGQFGEAFSDDSALPDAYGAALSYSIPILLYNADMVEKMGFGRLTYSSSDEQDELLDNLTSAAAGDSSLRVPGTCQAVLMRLGNHLGDMLSDLQRGIDSPLFKEKYTATVERATSYWKKYLISYPRMAQAHYLDFINERTPFFMCMDADFCHLAVEKLSFRLGSAMMYAADNTFPRIAAMLSIRNTTSFPVESIRVLRLAQTPQIQKIVAASGRAPLLAAEYSSLPYDMKISADKAARPIVFHSREENYIARSIINIELWNVVLFNKSIQSALSDIRIYTRAFLNMKLSRSTMAEQKRIAEIFN